MTPSRAGAWLAASLFAACSLPAAHAAAVTVSAHDTAGAAAADVIVVFDPLDAPAPPAEHGSTVIDQVNKHYVPRVTVVRTGTDVAFPNSDQIRHQVYSFSPAKTFNLKLYAGSPSQKVTFDKKGLVVLGCNIHDSMIAYVAVVDTPFFAKTGANGSALLTLPPGHYRVRVWHPNLSAPVDLKSVAVDTSPLNLPLTVALDPAHDASAAWAD